MHYVLPSQLLGRRYTNCRNGIQSFCAETVLERRGQRSRAVFSGKFILLIWWSWKRLVSVDTSTQNSWLLQADWLHRFESCHDYLMHLSAKELRHIILEITLSQESLKVCAQYIVPYYTVCIPPLYSVMYGYWIVVTSLTLWYDQIRGYHSNRVHCGIHWNLNNK